MSPQTTAEISAGVTIDLKGVSKAFDGHRYVLRNLDLIIRGREFLTVVGPSGCGKSTLLRLIAGLETVTSGEIQTVPKSRSSTSFVFQEAHLLPWLNVFENVDLPLKLVGTGGSGSKRMTVANALSLVGMSEAAKLYPSQLSGGMKMRVSLARAIVTCPDLILLDEPFGALDEITRVRLDEEILRLNRELGCTTVFVTHSLTEAVFLSDRVVLLSSLTGSILRVHTPSLPRKRDKSIRYSVAFGSELSQLENYFTELGA